MAPRRGGSSSSGGGSSSSTCPDAFLDTETQVSFANEVLFFVIILGIFITLFIFRRRKVPGKQLIGAPLIICLSFLLLTYLCSIIATILRQCETTTIASSFYWSVAISIFTMISYWLFLVVVVFTLNTMLRRQLGTGHSNAIFKIIPLAIIALIGVLACVVAGMAAYLNAETGRIYTSRYRYGYSNVGSIVYPLSGLRVAFYSLYLISLLVSGALALKTIMSLRKAGKAGGDLLGWVLALTIAMVFWTICYYASTYSVASYLALGYLVNFGQALSFIFILCIAKHVSWKTTTGAEPMAYQSQYSPVANPAAQPYQPYGHNNLNGHANEQYGYNANVNGQANHYHEAPEYVGTNNAIRA
ncbi:hypothetical protein HBI49_053620 [Parastagonospora nodorum]|nr:hypothetical protein HBI49_053620 [Parastagonospora nodorum]